MSPLTHSGKRPVQLSPVIGTLPKIGVFSVWQQSQRGVGELLVSPPTQAKWHVALLLEMVIEGVHNAKEVRR